MRRICAWCKVPMGDAEGPEGLVTHGMCPACEAKLMGEIDEYDSECERNPQQAPDAVGSAAEMGQ